MWTRTPPMTKATEIYLILCIPMYYLIVIKHSLYRDSILTASIIVP